MKYFISGLIYGLVVMILQYFNVDEFLMGAFGMMSYYITLDFIKEQENE